MNMKVENEMALPTTKSVAVMLLEPYAGKLARTVLRGESSRKGADLLDYVPGERLNMDRFSSLGVIEEVQKRPLKEIDAFFVELESIFASPSFTKEEVVKAIQRFIPHFEHEEKGKNLDQKM